MHFLLTVEADVDGILAFIMRLEVCRYIIGKLLHREGVISVLTVFFFLLENSFPTGGLGKEPRAR